MSKLAVILGDQLSHNLNIFDHLDKDQDEILMMEVMDEASYVKHHKKKLAFIFSCMRHFAEELQSKGYKLSYIKLQSLESKTSFTETLKGFLTKSKSKYSQIISVEASEYRVLEMQQSWQEDLGCELEILEDNRFICSKAEFKEWAESMKSLLMENFY